MDEAPPSDPGPLPRRSGILTLIFVAAILGGLAVASLWGSNDTGDDAGVPVRGILEIGAPAPDFEVELLDGTMFSLAEHIETDGRPVVLNFWASWCGPCRAEMPDLDEFADSKPGILVLGVAIEDTEENARQFAEELGVGYPLGIDEPGVLGAKYPYLGLPATWVIGGDGTLRREVIGQVTFEFLNQLANQEFGL